MNSGVISDSGSFKAITYNRLNTGNAYNETTSNIDYNQDGVIGSYGGQENSDQQSFFD